MVRVIGITTTRLNLRSGPGIGYPVLEVLKKGARFVVLEDLGGWLNVQAGGRIGYVDELYVTLHESGEPALGENLANFSASRTAQTTARVNLREGPGLEYAVLHTLQPGTRVDVFEDLGDWLNVFYEGRLAYIHENYVQIETAPGPVAPVTPDDSPDGDGLEMYALARTSTALRDGPGDEHGRLMTLEVGEEVRVLDQAGDWLEVSAGDQTGYVRQRDFDTAVRTVGVTTTVLNMRDGPGTQYAVVNVLPKGAKIEILEDLGGWFDARYEGVRGYVHGGFVRFPDSDAPGELVNAGTPASAPAPQTDHPEPREKLLLAAAWARNGADLKEIASDYEVEIGAAACVVAVETALQGFGMEGRLLLRFENHIFWHFWGEAHAEKYAAHFRFDAEDPQRGHAFREGADQQHWTEVHGGQPAEWAAFDLAAALDREAALRSVRMGSPQIFGYLHKDLGYAAVEEMFDAFAASEANQLRGLFALIAGHDGASEAIQALRTQDFETFARIYNGEAQGMKYAEMLRAMVPYFDEIRAGSGDGDQARRLSD